MLIDIVKMIGDLVINFVIDIVIWINNVVIKVGIGCIDDCWIGF